MAPLRIRRQRRKAATKVPETTEEIARRLGTTPDAVRRLEAQSNASGPRPDGTIIDA